MQPILNLIVLGITLLSTTHNTPAVAETDGPEPTTKTQSSAMLKGSNVKYVSDKLVIMMRAGPSGKHKIVRSLSSGTHLDVLETQDEYSHVVTSNGAEGWVLNQFLTDEPIAKHQLAAAKNQIAVLEAKNIQTKQELEKIKSELGRLSQEHQKVSETNQELQQENSEIRDLAEKPLALSTQNNKLSQKTITLESEVALLQQELQAIRDASNKQWFLTGAGVVLVSILLGVMLTRMRRVRRGDWGSSLNRF